MKMLKRLKATGLIIIGIVLMLHATGCSVSNNYEAHVGTNTFTNTVEYFATKIYMPTDNVRGGPAIYIDRIDGHDYLVTMHAITHSESCPCKQK